MNITASDLDHPPKQELMLVVYGQCGHLNLNTVDVFFVVCIARVCKL